MEQWLSNPVAWIAALAVAGTLIRIGMWVGSVNEHKLGVSRYIDEMRSDIKRILQRLPAPTIETSSPLTLTDLGKNVSQVLKAREWAERTAPSVTAKVAGKTPFDVQSFCFEYARNKFSPSPEQLAELQAVAYDNGIDMDAVLDVLAIELAINCSTRVAPSSDLDLAR